MCVCVCVCEHECLIVSVFVCFFADWRPVFGSCKFARICVCVCVCVCTRVCVCMNA